MARDPLDILTPQGYLSDIADDPNLEVVMNLFKIPRAFAVSGFGDWSVGQHSFCVAYLALYWCRLTQQPTEHRNQLMVLGLTHDLHESATGDILPGLKNPALRKRLDEIQHRFLRGLGVEVPAAPQHTAGPHSSPLEIELKLLDRVAFLYEIGQAAARDATQRQRLQSFFDDQRQSILDYAKQYGLTQTPAFLTLLGLDRMAEG